MSPCMPDPLFTVRTALTRLGLLLLSDPEFPSVASIVVGESLRGSWWGHPRGPEIYRINGELAEDPDVLVAKLISGKVTFVHGALRGALASVGAAREPWQMRGLPAGAKTLLASVDRDGAVDVDALRRSDREAAKKIGAAAKELELRLLVRGESYHSEKGAHGTRLESWSRFATRARGVGTLIDPTEAKRRLEAAARALVPDGAAPKRDPALALPWAKARAR